MNGIINSAGSKSGVIKRLLSGTNCYLGYNNNDNSTAPTWAFSGTEGTGVGFFLNDDNFLTHTDDTASFVCNIAGAYGVSSSVIPKATCDSVHIKIQKNGTPYTDTRGPANSGHGSASAMIILNMVPTDTISVVTTNATHGGFYCYISIFWLGVS